MPGHLTNLDISTKGKGLLIVGAGGGGGWWSVHDTSSKDTSLKTPRLSLIFSTTFCDLFHKMTVP